jgi:hypothetical protein
MESTGKNPCGLHVLSEAGFLINSQEQSRKCINHNCCIINYCEKNHRLNKS